MKKNTVNYIINTVMAALMLNIAFVGILLGFVIPRGERAGLVAKVLWGLHRHDWGEVHLYLSLSLLALIVVHVWLHWSWVVACTRRLLSRTAWGIILVVLVGAVAVFAVAWLVSPRSYKQQESGAGERQGQHQHEDGGRGRGGF